MACNGPSLCIVVPANCPSGNCTFHEPYRSVGYCSRCNDTSSQLNITTELIPGHHNKTTFELPNGLSASRQGSEDDRNFVMDGLSEEYVDVILGFADGNPEPDTLLCTAPDQWGCRGYGPARCEMYQCIKTYTASVQGGNFSEYESSNDAGWGWDRSGLSKSTADMSCLNGTDKDTLQKAGYFFNATTQWLPYSSPTPPGVSVPSYLDFSNSNVTDVTINASCVYQISSNFMDNVGSYLAQLFDNGSVSIYPPME
jgi:hypothetical protein